ncbi:hypothetical protein [Streptomyces spiralis]|uniref:hypothetical protein n=1 Tax=Streptomyces spiralis TaxID=66376 RepID=UPI0033DD402B
MAERVPVREIDAYTRGQWEDSPPGWPQPYETLGQQFRKDGRPTAQWARIAAGHDDDLHGGQSSTGGSGCCS